MDNHINYEELAQAVRERKDASPELQEKTHKEILSSVIREQHTDIQQSNAPLQPAPKQPTLSQNTSLPSYMSDAPQETKQRIESLIDYTFEHGLRAGIARAASEDPYIIDSYHDALTEKLMEKMKEKNLL